MCDIIKMQKKKAGGLFRLLFFVHRSQVFLTTSSSPFLAPSFLQKGGIT